MKDLNSYVNNFDLEKYLRFLEFTNPVLYLESKLTSIDEMFQGENYVAVILLNDENPTGIGHFVCLRKDTDDKYSYMDCLGEPVPDSLWRLFNKIEHNITIYSLEYPMMALENNICGKYCIQFCLSGMCSLHDFYHSLTQNKKYSADRVLNNLLQLNYERIV